MRKEEIIGLNYVQKTREYLDYIEEHLLNVNRAYEEFYNAMDGTWIIGDDFSYWNLRKEVGFHDVSKFSAEEFVPYRRKFFPVEGEEDIGNIKEAFDSHYKNNKHHHQTAENFIDVAHMIIDWMAMSYKFGGSARSYYEKNKDSIALSEKHVEFLYEAFDRLDNYIPKKTPVSQKKGFFSWVKDLF